MKPDPFNVLSPEEKLLISLCRLEFSEEQKTDISEQITRVKDWDRLVNLLNSHGIIALAAFNIHETGMADRVPEGIMKRIDNARMISMARNSWLVKRWKEVNNILTSAGIKHVLLKGMALEHTVYGSKGLRQMTDNDILVKKADVMKAWLILQENGFKSDIVKSPLHKKIITEIGKHMPTLRKDDYPVEIHHRLFNDIVKDNTLDNDIDNAVEIKVDGTRAFVLDDEIHLDYLKKHYQDHLITGGFQMRLWLDMEVIAPGSAPPLTVDLIRNIHRRSYSKQRKDYYRKHYFTLQRSARLRYLAGDLFPSLSWMKKRHECGWPRVLIYYPRRLGKILWLCKC